MHLVLVESPTKVKSLTRYLGDKTYRVMATYGHVRDLPSKSGSVDPTQDFHMTFDVVDKNKKHLDAITKAAKEAESLILATDPDREGEAISWHVQEHLKNKKVIKPTQRIAFNAITKEAVLEALKTPRDLDNHLIDAYLARLSLDYLVGFTLSPLLWRKLPGCRSAGRVQSAALRILCERAAEIEAFKPQEYWTIKGLFAQDKTELEAQLRILNGTKLEKFSLTNEADAQDAVTKADATPYTLSDITEKEVQRHPAAPFITSTLQQEASRKLGLPPTVTMRLAQQLYEGAGTDDGLITYMRTDSTTMDQSAIAAARKVAENLYGKTFVAPQVRVYKKKARNAQEAHEAIRPTNFAAKPKDLIGKLEPKLLSLYELIWRRSIASQMASARFNQVTLTLTHPQDETHFRASGQTCLFKGFLEVYTESVDTKDASDDLSTLPAFEKGSALDLKKLSPLQHFTEPPPHYTEASLIKQLEELGIGRPSTYARILQVLKDRTYVTLDKKKLSPTEKGRVVNAFLVHFFARYVESTFTARMEESLDEVSRGDVPWKKVLADFWKDFHATTEQTAPIKTVDVIQTIEQNLKSHLFGEKGSMTCPACGKGEMHLRLGTFGPFLGCNTYPDCRHVHTLGGSDEQEGDAAKEASDLPRTLGMDPEKNEEITLRRGPYGLYFQWGEGKKPKRVGLPKGMGPDEASLDFALKLGRLPISLGKHPKTGEEITGGLGRFGPYAKHAGVFTSVKDLDLLLENRFHEIVELIDKKMSAPVKKGRVTSRKGRT